MTISKRDITKEELEYIYEDFRQIEVRDGVPQREQTRLQFIADEDDRIIGIASGLTHHKWFYLTDLWVEESHRRQGLGSKLLEMLEKSVTDYGCEHIYTWTSGMINPVFYEKHGYTKFTVFENFYEIEGYNQVGYRKDFSVR